MSETSDDLSAVAWVHEELRRSIEAAHKALRRFAKETETLDGSDVDTVDPVVLRTARAQLHQGVGALELVGLPAAALVLRASEALVQRAVARPTTLSAKVITDIERASFALLDYLGRMLAGKTISPLSLFPQYHAVQDNMFGTRADNKRRAFVQAISRQLYAIAAKVETIFIYYNRISYFQVRLYCRHAIGFRGIIHM